MKITLKKKYYYLLIAAFLWLFAGIAFAFPVYKTIWKFSSLTNFSEEDKNLNLYGSDYKAYEYLNTTPKSTKILFMIPDYYYAAKAFFFLYPRQVKVISKPEELATITPNQFDYFLIYVSTNEFKGYIQGLNKIQSQFWTMEQLYSLEKRFNYENKQISFTDFQQKLANNRGVLLYRINNNL